MPDAMLPPSDSPRSITKRLKPAERRRDLLDKAIIFFAEHGMTAPTRALAEACGVAQRLLYRYFPSKAALLDAVYEEAIVAPFKAVWLVRLQDRSVEIEQRIAVFYLDYFQAIFTRQWLRLFLYAGLESGQMTSAYIDAIVKQLLEALVGEAAAARGVELPQSRALLHEIGWVLHGALSHLAIRREVLGASRNLALEDVLDLHIRGFLACLPEVANLARAKEHAENRAAA